MADGNKPEARTFYVDTRFEKKARRPGGVDREQALARAQTHVDNLKPEFTEWLNGELEDLRETLSRPGAVCGDDTALDRAYHNCSQLQDVGATMGYTLLTFVAKNLCLILDAIKAGMTYDQDIIDCHINALYLARMEPYCNLRPDEVPEMSSGLRRVVELAKARSA